MPAWVSRHSKWRVPEQIERAAIAAARGETPAPPDASDPASAPPANSKSRTPDADPAPAPPSSPINLEDYDPDDGNRLRELKQIQAAQFAVYKEKLKLGTATSLDTSKYLDLCETVDKIESRITERLKKLGLYIMRDAVERDLAAAAELFRQRDESMVRRVIEICPSLDATQRAEVSTAIRQRHAAEARILARLPSFQNGEDLLRELNAAA
jgi:hypothetical protein